jgi:peptide-methionine (S)-S-oxide reductase
LRLFTIVGVTAVALAALVAARDERAAPAPSPAAERPGMSRATFAGGCFWCMEPPFEKLRGVVSVTSGYTGGPEKNPTYEQVSNRATGHAESVEIVFDPKVVGYSRLLEVFWHNIDPTTADREFCDTGHQYRTAIFVHDAEQRRLAEESKRGIERTKTFPEPVVTAIEAAGPFYAAEDYHQDFYKKSPVRYYSYRAGCGRDRRLEELWGEQAGH